MYCFGQKVKSKPQQNKKANKKSLPEPGNEISGTAV